MSNTENNKERVRQFLEVFSTGNVDAALAFLDDDVTWWVAGSSPIAGTYTKAVIRTALIAIGTRGTGPMVIRPLSFIAEGDRVAVECESLLHFKSGSTYNNFYHYVFEFKNGKLILVKEYLDTQHAQDVLAPEVLASQKA